MSEPLSPLASWLILGTALTAGTFITVLVVLAMDAIIEDINDWRDRKRMERNAR